MEEMGKPNKNMDEKTTNLSYDKKKRYSFHI